jgi:hypothetical protein
MADEKERLIAAMNSEDPHASLTTLARALRDEGVAQRPLLDLFGDQLQLLSGDDPRYDAIADTMDFISGWVSQGHGLFDGHG